MLQLDERRIKAEDIGRLRACCPTADEVELLTPFLSDEKGAAALESAERFLLLIASVPRLSQRLDCFHTKAVFSTRLSDVRALVEALSAASACVSKSALLPELLALVLAVRSLSASATSVRPRHVSARHRQVGNALNCGSAKGSAAGFRLDVLQRLAETKSSTGEAAHAQVT